MVCFALGNPGKKYAQTRHNIGFMVADALAKRLNMKFESNSDYRWTQTFLSAINKDLVIVKPLLYMNNSGVVVKEYLARHPDDFIVVCDDFALPFGQLRFRERGSDGGHQGLASIIYYLQTNNFPRLRIGIGNPSAAILRREYVLTKFSNEERKQLPKVIDCAADALLYLLANGIKKAMSLFNCPRSAKKSNTEH